MSYVSLLCQAGFCFANISFLSLSSRCRSVRTEDQVTSLGFVSSLSVAKIFRMQDIFLFARNLSMRAVKLGERPTSAVSLWHHLTEQTIVERIPLQTLLWPGQPVGRAERPFSLHPLCGERRSEPYWALAQFMRAIAVKKQSTMSYLSISCGTCLESCGIET